MKYGTALRDKLLQYLGGLGWTAEEIVMHLIDVRGFHGEEAFIAMLSHIERAEADGRTDELPNFLAAELLRLS